MKNFWSVVILLALLLGLGLYFSSHVPEPVPADTSATSTSNITVSITKTHLEDKENKFVADIETPIISGHANAQAFNDLAKIYVDRATEQFAQSATEANFNVPETFKNQSHGFTATARVTIVHDRYVNVVFAREYDILGAAHPFHLTETLVYDLETKRVIELSHMFVNLSQALNYISTKSSEQIKAALDVSGAGESFIAGGAGPDEANFRSYIITDSGMIFFFAEYQVAPYAAGPQQASLTWIDLRPLLTPEFKALAN